MTNTRSTRSLFECPDIEAWGRREAVIPGLGNLRGFGKAERSARVDCVSIISLALPTHNVRRTVSWMR